jgi:hypothetical protein
LQGLLEEGVLAIGPVEDDPELEGGRAFWQAFGFSETPKDCPNYVTPAEIKGLEQDHVAVVGFGVLFGQLGLSDLWNWKDANDTMSRMPIAEARRFLAEFFLNRLYVACQPRSRTTLDTGNSKKVGRVSGSRSCAGCNATTLTMRKAVLCTATAI